MKNTYNTFLELALRHQVAYEYLKRMPDWFLAINDKNRYAHAPYYQSIIQKLPKVQGVAILDEACVGASFKWQESDLKKTKALLKNLSPWRKGGFVLGDPVLHIDTEWRSDLKWERIAPFVDLQDKLVLDVGGGSGYHGFRMAGAGAKQVIVIDPSCLFCFQFRAINQFVQAPNVHFLPIGLEQLPMGELFGVAFCMGVLYHRKSPFECLEQLKAQLKSGGTLVLETLVVEGDEMTVLVPQDRYAKMNNVYCLPSVSALTLWLQKVGFVNVCCVDVSITTEQEQRATEWMTYQSLVDFLDPTDDTKTCEGYPRPKRAVMMATKP